MLAAGTYALAISMWNNFACANGGCFPSTGSLADGFSGLPQLDLSRALYFEVNLEAGGDDNGGGGGGGGGTPVPEPTVLLLLLTGRLAVTRRHVRRM